MTSLVATVSGLAVSGLAVRIYMGREAEDRLASSEAVSLAELRSPLRQPRFLACPPHYCPADEAVASPVFDLPWNRLHDYWIEVISPEKRMVSVAADAGSRRYVYVQHSPTFRFRDVVTVEFVQLGPDRSSIAIYSQSRYGQFDFGKNRKRVERWLVLLEKVARPAISRVGRADRRP
jgi:Protein of unknown function (DUF1499)